LQESDAVFVYEDHGSDLNHETTRHVLEKLGMRVFWLGRKHGADAGPQEITNPSQLASIKKSRRFGYDFAASKSAFWIDRLNQIVKTQL
jgi:hypothetical protein